MGQERRTDERIQLNLSARYDGLAGLHEARIEDISLGGCFVNARGQVDPGEIVTLEIKLISGEWLPLRGEVTSVQPGIGFGMVFTFLTDDEEQILRELISSN
jgi:PilZ domain